jgi:hypothetical protein
VVVKVIGAADHSRKFHSLQVVAHIDFPAARCRLVIGKVRNSLIEFYFLSLARFFQRQRLGARVTMHKRRCQHKRAERLLEGFRIFPLLFAAHFISQQRAVNVGCSVCRHFLNNISGSAGRISWREVENLLIVARRAWGTRTPNLPDGEGDRKGLS